MTKRRIHDEPRRFWIPAEDRSLATLYPHLRTDDIAPILGRTTRAIYARAELLGLAKSAEFNASTLSGRNVKGHAPNGAKTRFPKGHVPANKGLRRPGWHRGRMRETQFKKGDVSKRWKAEQLHPVGDLKLDVKDGYVLIKVREGYNPWRLFHRVLWEDAHGPVPAGYALVFKNGDKLDIDLSNLELISRADLMRRNTYHRYPQPIPQLIQLRGALQRQINRRINRAEQQD
jgi:HNH endonuclease